MAAKQTANLIPLCHPLPLQKITVEIQRRCHRYPVISIQATVRTKAETGVEMEALTAVSVAALTLYDMAKALDKGMTIQGIALLSKTGASPAITTAIRMLPLRRQLCSLRPNHALMSASGGRRFYASDI
jgi:cyclic pyranopterin phosphate synthase